jgi:two-component system, chemotaxis family, chemotaxis protein CheV
MGLAADDGPPSIKLILPLTDKVSWSRASIGDWAASRPIGRRERQDLHREKQEGGTMATAVSNILLETGTNEVEILELFIDEGEYKGYYGVNVAKVLEIIPMPSKIMRPPHLFGTFATGIFNHRDKIVPMLDLAVWLGRQRVENVPPKVLITEFNNTVTAFLVSGVTRIHRATWSDIRPLDGYTEGLSESITGVIELDNKLVFLLDLEKAIGDLNPELAVANASHTFADSLTDNYRQIKVLHADDSLVIRNTVRRRFEEQRIFTVHSVTNGDEAWSYLLEAKQKISKGEGGLGDTVDVVLSDIEMPGMDGYHLCKRIKEDQVLRRLPVVLFSSLITEKLVHKGEAVGADGQFSKPDLKLMDFIKLAVEEMRCGQE